jgi:hypothetical protein
VEGIACLLSRLISSPDDVVYDVVRGVTGKGVSVAISRSLSILGCARLSVAV